MAGVSELARAFGGGPATRDRPPARAEPSRPSRATGACAAIPPSSWTTPSTETRDDDETEPARSRRPRPRRRRGADRLHLRHRPRRELLRALLPRWRARERRRRALGRAHLRRVVLRRPGREEGPDAATLPARRRRGRARAERLVAPLRVGREGPRHPHARHLPRRRGSREGPPRRQRAAAGPARPAGAARPRRQDHRRRKPLRRPRSVASPSRSRGDADERRRRRTKPAATPAMGPDVLDGDIRGASRAPMCPPVRHPPRRRPLTSRPVRFGT